MKLKRKKRRARGEKTIFNTANVGALAGLKFPRLLKGKGRRGGLLWYMLGARAQEIRKGSRGDFNISGGGGVEKKKSVKIQGEKKRRQSSGRNWLMFEEKKGL